MGKKLRIQVGELKVEAELNESKTAQLIWEELPIEGKTNLWARRSIFPSRFPPGRSPGRGTWFPPEN